MGILLGVIGPIRLRPDKEDCLLWHLSKNVHFTAKSWREAQWLEVDPDLFWNIQWHLKVPSKVVFFLWTTARGRLPTIDLLQHKGIILLSVCLLCMKEEESADHLFIHFPFVAKVWGMFLGEIGLD